MNSLPFVAEIRHNSDTPRLESVDVSQLSTRRSSLDIRKRGCYITKCSLYSSALGQEVPVLYSDPDLNTSKLVASHPMSPVGPYEGIGGQHGFPRWADYHLFKLPDDNDDTQSASFQAMRSDLGLGLVKKVNLSESMLQSETTLINPDNETKHSSLGEHFYFTLDGGFAALRINGHILDGLLGEGSEARVSEGSPLFWAEYDGSATIDFPAGYSINLLSEVANAPEERLGMLIWHKKGTGSICFEPTLGFDPDTRGDLLKIDPYTSASLSTTIQLN